MVTDRITAPACGAAVLRAPSPHPAARPEPIALANDVLMGELVAPEPGQADLAQELPADVAVLWVMTEGQDGFIVQGDHPDVPLAELRDPRFRRPNLTMGTLAVNAPGGKPPKQIYQLMRQWSRTKEAVQRWLADLHARYGDSLRLVIADTTPFDIPWELFFVGDDERDYGGAPVVGALFAVARWCRVAGGRNVLDEGPILCQGTVMAYVDDSLNAQADEHSTFGQALEFTSAPDLRDALRGERQGCALVYAACTGYFSHDTTEFAIGNEQRQVLFADLDAGRELHLFSGTTALMFLNACNSLRTADDPHLNDGGHGFAELFLRKGAAGVLGTTGFIPDRAAANVARYLVTQAVRTEAGVSPAVALFQLRREVAQRVQDQEQVEPWFLEPFMYLYFGHPSTVLRLSDFGDHLR